MKKDNRRKQFSLLACCCLISFIFIMSPGLYASEKAATEAKEKVTQQQKETATKDKGEEGKEVVKKKTPSAKKTQGEDIYSEDIKPLTSRECARCHYTVYLAIKQGKGAHKKACTFCHKTYHNFQRGLTWDQRVPHCTNCHKFPHGDSKAMKQCLKCHTNAHAPLASIKMKVIEPMCSTCHAKQAKELKDHPSGHSAVNCAVCHHDTHGFRPACTECHEKPHTAYKNNAACMACHKPHMPKNITYGPDVPNTICAGCHKGPVERMKSTTSAHGQLKCVFCHAQKHGNIPKCQLCHSIPHAKKMIEKFGDCSKCHGNPHDLNMKKVKE